MSDSFEKAKQALSPRGIYLRDSVLDLNEAFMPRDADQELGFRFFHGPTETLKHRHLEMKENDQIVDEKEEYIFLYQMGVDVAKREDYQNAQSDEEAQDAPTQMRLLATFELVYWSDEELPEEGLQEFANRNTVFHAWPYWREFVQSTCQRIGMANPIPVAHFHFTQKSKSEES